MAREQRSGGRDERNRRRDSRNEQGGDDLHQQIFELLLDKVREDPYPSTTHLDMLESVLQDEDVDGYAEALMDKVRGDTFPSIDHLNRLMKLA